MDKPTLQEIKDELEYRLERSERAMKETAKLSHNSYGAGMYYGEWDAYRLILNFINGIEE